ncbi:MAG: mitochondrial import receptor protein [Peltula sp. TS41687]|nr:MAG: mitochondrial import receptor protein [Peltula sp. TS41687]
MVKLKEVEDEHFASSQPDSSLSSSGTGSPTSSRPRSRSRRSSTSSVASSSSSSDIANETLTERLIALKDMIPPRQRAALQQTVKTTSRLLRATASWGGKSLWVISTSVLLVVVPWSLACVDEAAVADMEREMKAQQAANEVLTPGAASLVGGGGGGGQFGAGGLGGSGL